MWIYDSVTRQEFESIKDIVEKYIVMLVVKSWLISYNIVEDKMLIKLW